MNPRSFSRLSNMVLLLLLLASGIAFATALTWAYAPEFVNEAGARFASRVFDVRRAQLDHAVELLPENPASGVSALSSLIEELAAVRHGDRLAPLKVRAFSHVTDALAAENRPAEAVIWYDAWIAHDERNFVARARRAALLYRMPERRAEGLETMAALQRQVPEAPDVAQLYATMLFEDRDRLGALRVLLEQAALSRPRPKSFLTEGWSIYFTDQVEFSAERRIDLLLEAGPDGRFGTSFEVPAGVIGLRLDPPPNLPLFLLEPTVRLVGAGRADELKLWELPLRLNHVAQEGSALRTWGTDPYAVWRIERVGEGATGTSTTTSTTTGTETVTATVTAGLFPAPDERLLALVSSVESVPTERALEEQGARLAANALRSLRRDVADLHPISLAWRRADEPFAAERSTGRALGMLRASETERFEFEAQVGAPAAVLAVRLPGIPGAVFRRLDVEVETASGVRRVLPEKLRVTNDLAREGAEFRVTGAAPELSLVLQAEEVVVRVLVRGISG